MNTFLKLASVACVAGIVSISGAQVMNQIGNNPADFLGAASASQTFEPANAAFNIAAIDDFSLTSTTNLTSVDFAGLIFNNANGTWANVGNFSVDFYTSVGAGASNLTGDAASVSVLHANATINTAYFTFAQSALVTLPINVTLGPGTYWIGVRPDNNFGTNGQTGILNSGFAGGTPNNGNAFQVNPGGGFAFPGGQQQIAGNINLGYRITGSPVPEPATVAVLGLGALALLRRRNKKA